MIAYLQGIVTFLEPALAYIDVHGLGYEVRISLPTYQRLKAHIGACKLYTHLSIKEDAHTLFGFYDLEEKRIFLDLLSVSGVGPSTALVMLSTLSPSEIQHAIAHEDVKTLKSIKGLGEKTSQRVILELKDKMKKAIMLSGAISSTPASEAISLHNKIKEEALSALIVMGIAKATAEKNIESIMKANKDITLEGVIKSALRGN
jgi:holliday junction DNA helicase RuvA